MNNNTPRFSLIAGSIALALSAASTPGLAQEPFEETAAFVEINATDGDIGFQTLLDADAWRWVKIADPGGKQIFKVRANGRLARQGLAENFFESDEPVCDAGLVEEADDVVVTLAEFLQRFPAGHYIFTGRSNDGEALTDAALLTHNLPAAPDIDRFDGTGNVPTTNAVIEWGHGDDLGECLFDNLIPDPGSIAEVLWEVVVEPEDEEAADPLRVFSVQLPVGQTSVTVPQEFLDAYVSQGVTVFKFEVGAIEESGNRTFSEGVFCTVECPEED